MILNLLTAVSLLAGTPAAQGEAGIAQMLLRRIEERNARTRDLVARFSQSYRSGMLGRETRESGTVSIKRPGRMRWEYRQPERKLFLSDGRRFYFYVPAEKQAVVSEQDDERSLAARLLSGKGGLLEEFEVSLDEPLEDGVMRLALVPRREQPDLERAFLDVELSGRIRGIVLHDVQGNQTRFRFEGIRENVGLADELFRFEAPKGVEVIQG